MLGLRWTSDKPVEKASTYAGQYNSETHASSGIWTHDPSNQPTYALDRATTGSVALEK
jgi:hypothetical protein